MERLPNNVLVTVFHFLNARDLMAVRAVCRRWKSLALRRDVWKHVSLNDIVDNRDLFQAVLRTAPCIDRLTLFMDSPDPLLMSTSCAARSVSISIWDEQAAEAHHALTRQFELGHLRGVRLHMHGDCTAFVPLMEEISKSRGLLKVTLQNYRSASKGVVPSHKGQSSLQELHSDSKRLDRHHQFLLFKHSRTLQILSIPYMTDITARLLTFLNLEMLRKLECPPLDEMELLVQCPVLRSLTIQMEEPLDYGDDSAAPRVIRSIRGTVAFLRQDNKLEELKLLPRETLNASGLVKRMLLAPSSIRESALRDLEIGLLPRDSPDPDAPQRYLKRVLPNMPQLRRIVLSCRARAFLLNAMTPETIRNLQELHTVVEECAHYYIHRPEVAMVLQTNQLLHLFLRAGQCYDENPCASCRMGCHAVLANPARNPNLGFFVHGDHEPCGVDVHTAPTSPYLWVRV